MSENPSDQRLWSIETGGGRGGVPLWPLAIILIIFACIMGVLSVPCVGLRFDYLRYAKDRSKMNVWQMTCQKEGGECVCRQKASQIKGGENCELRPDLRPKCRSVSADYLPPPPSN